MSLSLGSDLNVTQQIEVLNALHVFAGTFSAPLLLVEGFMMGALCAGIPVGTYIVWTKLSALPRMGFIWVFWLTLVSLVAHWAVSLRQIESMISGRAFGLPLVGVGSLPPDDSINQITQDEIAYAFFFSVWTFLLPLLLETALFGFASTLFVIVCAILWQTRPRWSSRKAAAIPILAATMYAVSLVHWVVALSFYISYVDAVSYSKFDSILSHPYSTPFNTIKLIIALLSVNIILSDSIVIWRMCIVWDRARFALILGAALIVTTLGMFITNFLFLYYVDLPPVSHGNPGLRRDPDILFTFGRNTVGLASVFISLASNVCATALVGLKAWLHRRQLIEHACFSNRRTLAMRVMELLVESGIVYSGLWVLYGISFFRTMTAYTIDPEDQISLPSATFLDTAMAQITSIYPLAIFILVALDKIHYARGPQMLHMVKDSGRHPEAVTVTFEVDVERSAMRSPGSAYPMAALNQHGRHGDDDLNSVKLNHPRGVSGY